MIDHTTLIAEEDLQQLLCPAKNILVREITREKKEY